MRKKRGKTVMLQRRRMRAKVTPRRKLINDLDDVVRAIVRKRDKGICQWCGKSVEGCNSHDSHIIPKSRGNALRWDLKNHILLCYHCHINKWHKDPIDAWGWLCINRPEQCAYAEDHRHDTKQFKIKDLEQLLAELQGRL